jgi:prephenate dehydratase
MPGVKLEDVRCVLSHLVALSQCRTFLEGMRGVRAQPFYDTAGSVKHIMEERFGDTAAIAPALAAEEYGAEILVEGIEDHAENYTRFYLVRQAKAIENAAAANKCSVAFSVEHRPGTLVAALVRLAETGVDLTKIESRPVPGKPWEYVFYVEFRFIAAEQVDVALAALRQVCAMVKELGRFVAA